MADEFTIDVTPNWATLVRFFGSDCEQNLHGKTQKCVGVAIMPADGGILAYVRSGRAPHYAAAIYTKHEGRWMRAWSQSDWSAVKDGAFIWGELDFTASRMDMWEYAAVSFGGVEVAA